MTKFWSKRDAFELLSRGAVWWAKFRTMGAGLPPRDVRALLAQLEAPPPKALLPSAALFLSTLVERSEDDGVLLERWKEALGFLDGLQTYPFDKRKRKAKLQTLAREPRVVQACQVAAVGAPSLGDEMFGLLLLDASEASLDALLPQLERASEDHERLEQLERLRALYESPANRVLFERAAPKLATLREGSEVLALARRFGFEEGRFRVTVSVPAVAPRERRRGEERRDWLSVEFDSHQDPGWAARTSLETRGKSSSSSHVTRTFGGALEGLPRAMASAAKRLGVEWNFEAAVVRPYGRKRAARLLEWLSSARAAE